MDIITLIVKYFSNLLEEEEKFFSHLEEFTAFEQAVGDLSKNMAAEFIGNALTCADQMIRESGIRNADYIVQRPRQRTLISSVGDITFTHTVYKDRDGKYVSLLDRLLRLPDRERFTVLAEARMLSEAEVHSYQHAADSIETGGQTVTKQTVMNKVHALVKDFPEPGEHPEEKKHCEYLYIEADEDHIHSQKNGEMHGCFYGKLAYVFEGKRELCDGRRELVNPHYFGGLYPGSENNADFWRSVDGYIREHYDEDTLKCVYINSDGGSWIRAAASYVGKSRLVADKYHLMKYIYRAARFTLDSEGETIGLFYRYIHKNRLDRAMGLLDDIKEHCEGSERAVEECRTYLAGNWKYIRRAYRDKHALGCSAEGHVSHVYSERLSSRPMGWSEEGSDRMCKLRCFVRNYGREKIIDLVQYRREQEMKTELATGTDGMVIDTQVRKKYSSKQREDFKYAERMFVELADKSTIRKTLAIKEQLWI